MLSKNTKLAIYDLLGNNFRKGNLIPVSEIESVLRDNGLHPQEFGYPDANHLLKDLPEFISLRQVGAKGHKKSMMLFSIWKEPQATPSSKNEEPKKKENPTPTKQPAKDKPQAKANQRRNVSPEELQKIKKVFKDYVPQEEAFPMATISTLLKNHGISQKDFGYSKMKPLLQTLDFLSVKDISVNNTPQALVIYHGEGKKNPALQEKGQKPKAKKDPQPKKENTPLKKENPVPKKENPAMKKENPNSSKKEEWIAGFLPEDTEFNSKNFSIPEKQILSLKQMTGIGYDNDTFFDLIAEDATSALRSHIYKINGNDVIVPLSISDRSGEHLICAIRRAEKKFSYRFFSNYIGPDKEKSKDILKREIRFADFDKSIQELALLAKPEPWHYRHSKDEFIILKIYLQYTYFRLANQQKISYDPNSGFACFHTGLFTSDYEEIYGVMLKNTDPSIEESYLFQGFTVAGRQGIGKILVEHFSPLPHRATYIERPQDIFFDSTRKLYVEYDHIIKENIARFPLDFLKKITLMYPSEHALVEKIAKEKSDYRKEALYDRLEESLGENTEFYDFMMACLDRAILKALALARNDYRAVLPSFFPTRNVLSLMLPLIFDSKKGPEAVLLVERTESGNYQGQTILTLKQCYVNSRLIAPVDNTFLNAEKIED